MSILNRTFGFLTVLEEYRPEDSRNTYVRCRCICGAEVSKRKSAVADGSTKSCGCKRGEIRRLSYRKNGTKPKGNKGALAQSNRKISEEKAQALVGKRFNWLTVISVQSPKVTCQCECGRTKVAHRSDVVAGKTTSCGCKRAERLRMSRTDWPSYPGMKYGKLELIQVLPDHRCVARCECGVEKEYFIGNLTQGQIKSCGCSSFEIRAASNLEKYGSEIVSCTVSRGERELRDWVKSLGLVPSKKVIKSQKGIEFELDIVVEDLKIAIEYNGERFHSDLFRSPAYHKEKSDAAEHNGYRLIHIFENEWKGRSAAVKSFLRSALGKNTRKIAARKVELATPSTKEARTFLESYHLLGFVSGIYVGCYYEGELVALAVFRNHHVKNKGLTLARWCGKDSVTVQGALSKVMANFCAITGAPPQEVITWVDLRLAGVQGYLRSGWGLASIESPDYFYFDPRSRRVVYKYSRRKRKVDTPQDMTESEHAALDGLYRIWDCGKARLSYFAED